MQKKDGGIQREMAGKHLSAYGKEDGWRLRTEWGRCAVDMK